MAKSKYYNQWEKKANKIYENKLKSAKKKGYLYENFGQKETMIFSEKMNNDDRLTYSEKVDLKNTLSDKFAYTDERDLK